MGMKPIIILRILDGCRPLYPHIVGYIPIEIVRFYPHRPESPYTDCLHGDEISGQLTVSTPPELKSSWHHPRLGSAGVKRAARLGMLFPGGLTRIFGFEGWLVVKMAMVSNAAPRHDVFLQILWIFFSSSDLLWQKRRQKKYAMAPEGHIALKGSEPMVYNPWKNTWRFPKMGVPQ